MGCCLSAGKVTAPPVAAAAKNPPPIEEETVNFSTATAASILEDDAVSKPHRHPLPPSSSRRSTPERISRSPGGRHSPQGKLRPRLVRERPYNQPNPTHNRRNVVYVDSSPLPQSELLEGPRRRSGSPATRGPSSTRRSPMKKRGAALEKEGAEGKVKKEEEKVAAEVKKELEEDDVAVRDPEVSMECFIFL
ncbi:hypothetical protein Bca101_015149 [Brassica carinata]